MKWETRTICTFIAASVPVEKAGDVSPLMEAANMIGVDPADAKAAEDKAQSLTEFDPENPPMPSRDNSFEGFMGSFGSPTRWAGAN